MRKARRGFTLVETVVTIGILAIVFSLLGITVSQLTGIQNNAADLASYEQGYKNADSLVNEFVSFVSVENNDLSFAYSSSSSSSLTFDATDHNGTYAFTISFSDATLNVYTPENAPSGYLSKSDWPVVKGISGVIFAFDPDISFLVAEFKLDESHSRRYEYVVRCQL